MTTNDDVFEQAAALPRNDVDTSSAARIRELALARFRAAAPPRSAPPRWTGAIETAFVVASVVGYLGWTAATFSSLAELRTRNAVHAAAGSAPRAR